MGLLKLVKYIARFYWILMLVMHALNYRAGVHSWLQNHAEHFGNYEHPTQQTAIITYFLRYIIVLSNILK